MPRNTPGGGGPPPDGADGPDGAGGGARGRGAGAVVDDAEDLSPEEQEAMATRLDELREQLVATPAEVVVANHAYGLFELAAIHLSQQPPRLDQVRLAVDAMGAVVEGLGGRLGEAEPSLREALAQIRLAYVQISGTIGSADGAGDGQAAPSGSS